MMVNAGRGAGAIAKVEFEPWQPNDAAVFINIGQSNSEGGTRVKRTEIPPLSNVYMMKTAQRDWSPYQLVDEGGASYPFNVFRDPRSPLPNIAHAVAEQWQNRIDNGEPLPDLYVITCAHGGQGFSTKLVANSNRWHTDYKQGPEGEGNPDWEMPVEGVQNINASLYELLYQAVKKGCAKLYAAGKRPRILPIMWVGAEAEANRSEAASKEIATNYILFHNLLAERWNMPYIPFWQLLLRNPGRPYLSTAQACQLSVAREIPHGDIIDPFEKWNSAYDSSDSNTDNFNRITYDGTHYIPSFFDDLGAEYLRRVIDGERPIYGLPYGYALDHPSPIPISGRRFFSRVFAKLARHWRR